MLKFFKKNKKRSFAAANPSSFTLDWENTSASINQILKGGITPLRSKARELCQNNDFAKKFLQMCISNIIGPKGITLQSKVKTSNGDFDIHANKSVELAFLEWGRIGNCDVTGLLSFRDIEELVLKSVARDGEVIIRIIKNKKFPFGIALQLIEADHLDENLNQVAKNGNQIKMGIEVNEWNKPIAYYLRKNHPNENLTSTLVETERIDASEIIHLFKRDRVSQLRGVSWFHSSLINLKQLEKYQDSEITSHRIAASKMGFFTSETNDQFIGNDVDNNGNPIKEVEPGMFQQLPRGWDFRPYDPQHTSDYSSFVKTTLRGICSGLGVSYNSLANDLEGVNFSSMRSGAQEERENWKILQNWFTRHFHQKIFEQFLEFAILNKKLNISFSRYDSFKYPKWMAKGFSYIDPVKDIKASVLAYENGMKTLSDILSESGKDFEETLEQLKFEKDIIKSYGLDIGQLKNEINNDEKNHDEENNDEVRNYQ